MKAAITYSTRLCSVLTGDYSRFAFAIDGICIGRRVLHTEPAFAFFAVGKIVGEKECKCD